MMNNGWTEAQWKDLNTLINSHHFISMKIQLLDLDHNYEQDLSNNFFGGQVSGDITATTTRGLDLTLFDPTRSVAIDPDAAGMTSVYFTNMIKVVYTIQDPLRTRNYDVPVFCGPIDKPSRDGVFLNLKCVGKEVLSLSNMWRAYSSKKNVKKTDVMKYILRNICGETKYDIPDLPYKSTNPISISRDQNPWQVLQSLAASMGYMIFYDGRGVCKMRIKNTTSVYVFDESRITARPQVSYDQSTASNACELTGGVPKGSKKRVTYAAVAPAAHPLNPYRVGRGGVPRYINPILINDSKVRTKAEAVRQVNAALNTALLESIEVSFDALPNPLLEEGDVYTLKTSGYTTNFSNRKWTVPLEAGDDSTIGYLRRVTPSGKRPVTRRA